MLEPGPPAPSDKGLAGRVAASAHFDQRSSQVAPRTGGEPAAVSPRRGSRRVGNLTAGLRDFGRRRRTLITIVGSVATAAALAFLLAGRREEFTAALSSAAAWVLAVTALLQIVALLARSEAWHLAIRAAGGTVDRRVLYRASSKCRSWAA
jgi:hypothetical protein